MSDHRLIVSEEPGDVAGSALTRQQGRPHSSPGPIIGSHCAGSSSVRILIFVSHRPYSSRACPGRSVDHGLSSWAEAVRPGRGCLPCQAGTIATPSCLYPSPRRCNRSTPNRLRHCSAGRRSISITSSFITTCWGGSDREWPSSRSGVPPMATRQAIARANWGSPGRAGTPRCHY